MPRGVSFGVLVLVGGIHAERRTRDGVVHQNVMSLLT